MLYEIEIHKPTRKSSILLHRFCVSSANDYFDVYKYYAKNYAGLNVVVSEIKDLVVNDIKPAQKPEYDVMEVKKATGKVSSSFTHGFEFTDEEITERKSIEILQKELNEKISNLKYSISTRLIKKFINVSRVENIDLNQRSCKFVFNHAITEIYSEAENEKI